MACVYQALSIHWWSWMPNLVEVYEHLSSGKKWLHIFWNIILIFILQCEPINIVPWCCAGWSVLLLCPASCIICLCNCFILWNIMIVMKLRSGGWRTDSSEYESRASRSWPGSSWISDYSKTLIFCVHPISRVALNCEIKCLQKLGFTVTLWGCFHCNLAAEYSSVDNTSPDSC